jgi:hypothetical protein
MKLKGATPKIFVAERVKPEGFAALSKGPLSIFEDRSVKPV